VTPGMREHDGRSHVHTFGQRERDGLRVDLACSPKVVPVGVRGI
jgi:hypothetical protein